ncbi:MAG: TonB-dependent receptor plug domain-containing protein [Pseudomonadota bacterium]
MTDKDFSRRQIIGIWAAAAWTALAWATPAKAQEVAAAEPAAGSTTLDAVQVVGRSQARASNTITTEDLRAQAPGVAPQALLNALPGVNVQQTDPYGLYEFGSTVRIRGFTGDQLATIAGWRAAGNL